jgi:hypothetical protein
MRQVLSMRRPASGGIVARSPKIRPSADGDVAAVPRNDLDVQVLYCLSSWFAIV